MTSQASKTSICPAFSSFRNHDRSLTEGSTRSTRRGTSMTSTAVEYACERPGARCPSASALLRLPAVREGRDITVESVLSRACLRRGYHHDLLNTKGMSRLAKLTLTSDSTRDGLSLLGPWSDGAADGKPNVAIADASPVGTCLSSLITLIRSWSDTVRSELPPPCIFPAPRVAFEQPPVFTSASSRHPV